MPTLPPSTDITSPTATEGNAKTWFAAVRTYIATLLGEGGTQSAALSALGAPLNAATIKTGAYTVVAADRGKVVSCSGTWTLAITAAATLGDGFVFGVQNTGSGTITIDPNLSEQIDGQSTQTIEPNGLKMIYCDGTRFTSVGGGVSSFNTRTGAITLTTADVNNTIVTGNQVGAILNCGAVAYSAVLPFVIGSSYSCSAGRIQGTGGNNTAYAISSAGGYFDSTGTEITLTGTWKLLEVIEIAYKNFYFDGSTEYDIERYAPLYRFQRTA